MPEVYAQKFQVIQTEDDEALAYRRFSDALRSWVGKRWPQDRQWFERDRRRTFRTQTGMIFRWEPFVAADKSLYDFTWRHPDASDPRHSWAVRVAYSTDPGRRQISVRISNDFEEKRVLTTRPRLVVELCRIFACSTDGRQCTQQATRLDEQGVVDVVDHELLATERRHPVLVLSPAADGSYVFDPKDFGEKFMTLGSLYVIDDPAGTFALTEKIGCKELSCFHGAMRVYLPGLRRDSPPSAHPLYLPRHIEKPYQRMKIAESLALFTRKRFAEIDVLGTYRDERAVVYEEERREIIASYKNQIADASDSEDYERLAILYAEENQALTERAEALERDLEEATSQVEALQIALRHAQKRGAAVPEDDSQEYFEPEDVRQAVEIAAETYGESLLFLPSAFDSAAKSPYDSPGEVLRVLEIAAEVSRLRMTAGLGANLKDVFAEKGVDYRMKVSDNTPKKLRRQFMFRQDGTQYDCEEHLCMGGSYDPRKCVRIHLSSNGEGGENRLVIGYVGKHLKVLSTN